MFFLKQLKQFKSENNLNNLKIWSKFDNYQQYQPWNGYPPKMGLIPLVTSIFPSCRTILYTPALSTYLPYFFVTSILTRETKHKLSVFTNRETVRATRQAEARGPSPLLARGKTTAWTKRRRWRTRRRTDGAHRPLAMGAGHARVKMKGNDARH